MNGAERYRAKRKAGVSSTRYDGTEYSEETDDLAGEAEEWAANEFGVGPNHDVYKDTRGDGGLDFNVGDVKYDAVYIGERITGHLIKNLGKVKADRFVGVRGKPGEFEWVGWCTQEDFLSTPCSCSFYLGEGSLHNFGNNDVHAIHTDNLRHGLKNDR